MIIKSGFQLKLTCHSLGFCGKDYHEGVSSRGDMHIISYSDSVIDN